MKMYLFKASTLETDKGYFVQGATGEFNAPVPYYLIEHEKGYVLFDSGHNWATVEDPKKVLHPGIIAAYQPQVYEDAYVLNTLKKVGIKPEDIVYNVCSHLHFDHAGGIGLFPNAKYILQKKELYYALVPDPFMKNAYLREDFDKEVDWLFLDGWNSNKYDIFGDGKMIIYYTPGHTPGHQSLLLNFAQDGQILLTADACYTTDNLEGLLLSGLSCDNSTYIDTLRTIGNLKKQGVKIITGHDPDDWKKLKQYPEFYS